jgi:hypothetical protein
VKNLHGNGHFSLAFADPPEKNGPNTTDRTKKNHQEETVTSSWTQPKAVTYRVTSVRCRFKLILLFIITTNGSDTSFTT